MTILFNQLKSTTFPDGMSYKEHDLGEDNNIIASIRSFQDLIELGQLVDVQKRKGIKDISLVLHYLVGSRMDRPIDRNSPNTLKVVCDIINGMGFESIKTVWSHSQSTNDRLNAEPQTVVEGAFINTALKWLLEIHPQDVITESTKEKSWGICLPDAGAAKRYWNDHSSVISTSHIVVECGKHRNMRTGQLSGFSCPTAVPDHCIIVDDLCDGGGTFCGLASELRKSGAKRVDLVVYHGIFSKGVELEGIDKIYTSNSYRDLESTEKMFVKRVV